MPSVRHRPLRPVVDDAILLRRPESEQELRDAVDSAENVLVLGDPGAGKSTLLNVLVSDLDHLGRRVVQVQASLARDAQELLDLVEEELASLPEPLDETTGLPALHPEVGEPLGQPVTTSDAVRLARRIRRLGRFDPAVVVLDELYSSAAGADLFARGRDALWATGHQWVLAAQPEQEAELARPPAGAFWSRRVRLPGLREDEAERLLRLRGIDPERVSLAKLIWESASPRAILLRATQPHTRLTAVSGDVEQGVPTSDDRLLDALIALDRPVAADDDELLRRLGWSRAYAQRRLRNLLADGRVGTTVQRRDTPGRPKTLYRAPTVEEES